jgi:hypothetical protein
MARGAVTRCAIGLLLVSSTAGTALALGQEPPEYNAKCGELDCRIERVPSRWELLDVKRDRRALKIVYESGGCFQDDGRATVTETRSRIEIAVDQGLVVAMDTPDGDFACTSDLRFFNLIVRLDGPVAGRRVVGGPRTKLAGMWSRAAERNGRLIPLAPRVLGLAAQDARKLLMQQGFEVTGPGRGRVVGQEPAPGKRVGRDGVRLTVSR